MSVASDYLKLRQQRQNEGLLELMGRKRDEQKAMTGGYHQMPQLESVSKSGSEALTRQEGTLAQRKQALTQREAAMKDEEALLSFLQNRAENLRKSYAAAPSQSVAAQYKKACADFAQAQQKARNNYLDYLAEYDAYESEYKSYSDAVAAYQGQAAEIQARINDWRSSIRNADAVKQDLDSLDGQIKELQMQERSQLPLLGQVLDAVGVTKQEKSGQLKALEAKRDLLQEEYDWSRYYQYADLMGAEDFAEKSKYVSTANGQDRSGMDVLMGNYSAESSGWDDPLYEYINGNKEAGAFLSNQASASYGADNPLGALFGRTADSKTESQQMTEDEVAVFNYLYATRGKEAAHAYYDYLQEDLNHRQRKQSEDYWKAFAKESPGAASVFSLAMSPLKGLSYVGQLGDMLENGKLEKDAAYNQYSYANSAIRNQVAEQIGKNGKWGQVGSFAYQTGMSMADFLLNTALSGGNSTLAMAVMGSGAAAEATLAAKDRGLQDGQAFALGTVAGLAEAFTEKYSLDTLLDATSLGKNAAGYIAKNMLAEGSEEGASSLINLFADILISKDKSQWNQSIAAFKAQGMDDGEAFGRAFADQAASIGLDVLGGALSGGIMAGGGVAINKAGDAVNRVQQKLQDKKQQPTASTTFQEDIQKQVTENIAAGNGAQTGTARLENMQVEIDEATFQQGQRLAKALGRNVVFYTAAGNENGYFENGVIYINTRGNDPLLQVFSHELTHSIEGTGSYGELSRIVLERMEHAGVVLEVARQAKRDLYARNGKTLASEMAVDQELVAEYVSKYLLTDEGSITDLVVKQRSLGQRIKNWFDKTLALLGNQNAQERAFLARARDLYAKALQQTQGSFTAENAGTPAPMGESAAVQTQAEGQVQAEANAEDDLDWENDPIGSLDALYARGDIDDGEYNAMREAFEQYQQEQGSGDGRRYSISEIQGEKESYGQGAILDTDIFDGVKPSAWGKVLSSYVYSNLAGSEMTVYDENGNGEQIYLARTTDRVRKDGAKNSHKVLDKLARYTGDNTKALATVHLSEVLETSKYEKSTDEHNHQWMDENGWELRKAYIQDRNGRIYEATLNIAKGRDRNILYAISNVKQIDKRAARGDVPAAVTGRGSLTKSNSSNESVPQGEGKVKRQYSISEDVASKKDVAGDLRAILKRGGSTAELRQYVAQLERSGGKTERKAPSAEQTGGEAERILKNAKRQGIGVEEYLRQNWEQYDQDGQWNADARKALEMEKQAGRKYSLSEDNNGRKLSDEQAAYFANSQARDGQGRLLTLYHQTENEFTVFDLTRNGAGSTDDATPFGIFMKVSATDIGLRGKRQMELYANITNPLHAYNREVLTKQLEQISPEYAALVKEHKELDEIYRAKFEDAKKALLSFMQEWRKNNPNASRQALYDVPKFDALYEAEDTVVDEWTAKADALSKRAKETLTQALRDAGYDGVILANDTGSFGRSTDAYIALDPAQVKNVDNKAPTSDSDIRYSITEEVESSEAESDIRSTMPRKAQEYLKRAERSLLWKIGDALSVPKLARREYLVPIIQELSDEYMKTGTIAQEKLDLLFDKAYAEGVIVDAEFYNQYKDIKDHLRTLSVTISERDQGDIADFKLFKKRAFGTLRIVNEGGLPVDTAYQELREMAPELFPESITHPADQLVRMFDAARSIQVTEKTVQDYYGKYEPEYRRAAKRDFEAAVGEVLSELHTVKRFADEKKSKESQKAPATAQEAMEAYKELKAARRNYERTAAKNLLTAHDEMQVGRLLRHEIELEHLDPEKDNVKGITAVYEAKAEYDRLCKLIGEYKQHLRGKQRKLADKYLETANSWKDKKAGIFYARETMRRNIQDIVPDADLARQINAEFFEPVHRSEAESNRFRTKYRDRVRELNLSTKAATGNLVSEAHAVQLLGEAEDNIRMLENMRGRIKNRDGKNLSEWQAVIDKLWAENPNLDRGKIQSAVKSFRKIYDELFQRMNEVRVANGYEPVNYRNGYFPHFQPGDSDSILAQFGKMLGIDTQVDALPTTINGLTHTFKPGIQWFGNAQERLGFNTAYDAVEGFDKYIEGVASVIYHTENIQKLRALATQIRYRTSEKGIQEQVDAIYADNRYSEDEKQVMINEIYSHGKFALSNFVTELDEYTNLLANKKSKFDRTIEATMGRKAYTIMKAWEARVGANMIAGNLTSALTNFIPLTQAGAQMDRFSLLQGMWGTLQAYRTDDGIVGMSSFLTNRRGSDPLVKTWAQKASGVLGTPMELIDNFTADAIVRGAYYQNLKRGLSEVEAMNQADIFASNVMADRSKGSMPTLLQASNPLFKAFTQFQLEVNNQFSEVFKDLPRGFKEKGLKALALVLLKYFLGAFLYNELYEKLIGRRPAMDPIGILCDAIDDSRNWGIGQAGANLAVNLLEQLPFSAGLSLVGIEIDGGRIPASAAVPDLSAIWSAATTEGWGAKKRWKEVQEELNKLAYVVPPFGGNQVSKIWKGVKAYIQGGSYSVDAKGNDILQYPVYKDNAEDAFWSLIRASLLGKSSLQTAQDWVANCFDSMGAKQTAVYQDMLAAGVNDREAFALLQQIQNAQETGSKKKDTVQREILRDSNVSGNGKSVVYYGLMATEKERELMDRLADMGADAGVVTKTLMAMRDTNSLKGNAAINAKYAAIQKAALTDDEKAVLVGSIIGTDLLTESGGITQYAKFQYAIENGMSVDEYISYRSRGASIDDYLELRDAGASIDDAMEAGIALQELKNSVEDPTTVQKWRTVINSTNDVQTQLISLSIVMSESQYQKVQTAYDFGISPETYVRINESLSKYDADANGRYTQAEVTKAIQAMKMGDSAKAVLWQLVTGASSARNNPYSADIGQKVIDAISAAKEKSSNAGHSFEDEIRRQLMGG